MRVTPDIGFDSEFAAGLREGRLIIGHCLGCRMSHHFRRAYCPHCGSDETVWRTTAGSGEIYSYTIVQRKGDDTVPALIRLPEGPTVLAMIVDCAGQDVAIGMPVKHVAGEHPALPWFAISK